MGKEGGERLDIDFRESPEIMKSRYMDVYDEHICRSGHNK